MNEVTTVGIDLAKQVFSVHAVDARGRVVLRQSVSRGKLAQLIAQLPPSLIGMEACGGAHDWARRFALHGHTVKLMAAQFVKPYRKGGKNDDNDAEAICEAVSRPSMRFVPVKTLQQQVQLSVHRVRQGFVQERTAHLNRLRGLLMEVGHVAPLGVTALRRALLTLLEQLPAALAQLVSRTLQHVRGLDEHIGELEQQIRQQARQDERACQVQQLKGIGPMSASAVVSTVSDPATFRNGRQFAAWLGLVPRQHSTGGKQRLGQITRSGEKYLRTLLVLGARAVLREASRCSDPLSRWALALRQRRGYHRACVAIAAKNARRVWAILAGRTPQAA